MEIIVALTGASGIVYGVRCIEVLTRARVKTAVVASAAAAQVMAHELGVSPAGPVELKDILVSRFGADKDNLSVYADDDLMAPFCSGSHKVDGMIVIPCSMSTLARINQGIASSLILRSADVMLKERRKLVLVPRETPLSLVHLRNMTQLTRAGVIIVPAMPAFYHQPKDIQEIIDFVVGKALDQFGLEHGLFQRFGTEPENNKT